METRNLFLTEQLPHRRSPPFLTATALPEELAEGAWGAQGRAGCRGVRCSWGQGREGVGLGERGLVSGAGVRLSRRRGLLDTVRCIRSGASAGMTMGVGGGVSGVGGGVGVGAGAPPFALRFPSGRTDVGAGGVGVCEGGRARAPLDTGFRRYDDGGGRGCGWDWGWGGGGRWRAPVHASISLSTNGRGGAAGLGCRGSRLRGNDGGLSVAALRQAQGERMGWGVSGVGFVGVPASAGTTAGRVGGAG